MEAIQAAKQAADRAYKEQQYQQAICKYGEALQASENSLIADLLHVLYSNRAAAKLAEQDYLGALADSQSAVAVNDKWVKGWYRSAKALQGLGRVEAAAQAASRALQLEPANKEVKALVQALKQHSGSSSSKDTTRPSQLAEQPQQQQKQQAAAAQALPWQQLCALRQSLDLALLPHQLVCGSQYLPSADGVNQNLLLLLHGLGDKPAAFAALARRIQLPQTACLALSGPLEVPETGGGRAWFRAYDDDWELIQPRPGEKRRLTSLATALQLLQQQLLPALSAAGAWQPHQVQVLGFSQGGTVALELARHCRGSQRLGGVVAVSAALLEEQLEQHYTAIGSLSKICGGSSSSSSSSSDSAEPGTDVLITHGDRDDVVPRNLVERTVGMLRQAGCEVQLQLLPGKGHGMISGPAEMRACMAFWAARLRVRPQQAGESYVEVPKEAAAAVLGDLQA
ncbi:Alpha/Beta hydrolase protein [Scenedesmus sp. NREL 46B-D3]|nr:Alpha/Beta hydrolase protein [Scenedesmus sp. NREL 46B-D3]